MSNNEAAGKEAANSWLQRHETHISLLRASASAPDDPSRSSGDDLTGFSNAASLDSSAFATRSKRRIREEPPDERYRIRQRDTAPVLDTFKLWLDKTRPRALATGKLGQALAYAHNRWQGLTRFYDDGRLAITTMRSRTPSGLSALDGATGCSALPVPARTPAPICTRSFAPPKLTVSNPTPTCAGCSLNGQRRHPSNTSKPCDRNAVTPVT
ncbi:MAG: hypothetical protein ACI9DC_002331 [Gammaproteobacteria bacterium]|jgi:hypothetical protein